MNVEEQKLLRVRELKIAQAARKALDHGKADEALALIETISGFNAENLITLASVIGFYSHRPHLVSKAYSLFSRQLGRCSNYKVLTPIALWMKNPSRTRSIPFQLKNSISDHRKRLDPEWNGEWVDSGTGPSNRGLQLIKMRPEEVWDPRDCLIAAGQNGDWYPWINRYQRLGGSTEDPMYLKIHAAKVVSRETKFTPRAAGLLRKFARFAHPATVKSFLRGITPDKASLSGKNPDLKMARVALAIYGHGQWEQLELSCEDWLHIARCAIFLDYYIFSRIIHRILLELRDSSDAVDLVIRIRREMTLAGARIHCGKVFIPALPQIQALKKSCSFTRGNN